VSRVLVVEDEPTLLRALAMNLAARGYDVAQAGTGSAALASVAAQRPHLILLDLGLPDLTGLDVIRGVRSTDQTLPIIVLSARRDSSDKVAALDLGADDYVTKPFGIDELLARIRAATRRAELQETGSDLEPVRLGATSVDLVAKTAVRDDGSTVHLTPTEWHLLETLLRHPGRLVSRSELLIALRGSPDHTDASYLRIYMAQLRRKLEPEPGHPRHLVTEAGMGYRFQP
jgi:two-component system KDP operon response regulator KdpE